MGTVVLVSVERGFVCLGVAYAALDSDPVVGYSAIMWRAYNPSFARLYWFWLMSEFYVVSLNMHILLQICPL